MIEALDKLDRRTAAGVVARAALAMTDHGNPSAHPKVPGEDQIRSQLLEEARARLHLAAGDDSPEVVERVVEFLDEESERLIGAPDTDAALKRLAERGDLPSDLYEIRIIQDIPYRLGPKLYPLERELIEATIRRPNREQHYGRAAPSAREPSLVSLFYREFTTPFPFKNFGFLVAAGRDGLILNVHQAWRIYANIVNTAGVSMPVDLLRRFADAYASEIEVEGKRGHFFLFANRPVPAQVTVRVSHRVKTVTQFLQIDTSTGESPASLIVSIDLTQYLETLSKMHVPRDGIRELASATKVSAS